MASLRKTKLSSDAELTTAPIAYLRGFKANIMRFIRRRTIRGVPYLFIREVDFERTYKNWRDKMTDDNRAHLGLAGGGHDTENCWCATDAPDPVDEA